MSFDSGYLTMMPSTMSLYEWLSFDNYGEPTYSTAATTIRCRMEYTATAMRDALGDEVISGATAYLASTSVINPLSKFVLPDGSTGIVLSIEQNWDGDGIHHNVARFGAS